MAVKVYLPRCEPSSYEKVAKLDASKLGNFSSYQFNRRWIKALRKQAGSLGANGVLLFPLNDAASVGAVRHGPGFKASAISSRPVKAAPPGTNPWAAECKDTANLLRYEVFHGWGPRSQQGGP